MSEISAKFLCSYCVMCIYIDTFSFVHTRSPLLFRGIKDFKPSFRWRSHVDGNLQSLWPSDSRQGEPNFNVLLVTDHDLPDASYTLDAYPIFINYNASVVSI